MSAVFVALHESGSGTKRTCQWRHAASFGAGRLLKESILAKQDKRRDVT